MATTIEAPLYVLVSLWVRQGQVAQFEAYESNVVRIMKRHGGIVERVIRTSDEEGAAAAAPFEIHLLRFPDMAQFEAYRTDAEHTVLADQRTRVIAKTEIIIGRERRMGAMRPLPRPQ